jgi:hypothetical protein
MAPAIPVVAMVAYAIYLEVSWGSGCGPRSLGPNPWWIAIAARGEL